MILQGQKDRKVERGNLTVATTNAFQIKTSAHAFALLSSGLYSDKIRAILRELSCNAWDSHVAAKQTLPFEVHFPNSLEPWFGIRDFGVGLSHEDMVNLMTTYFSSNKGDSNDFVGALGLGSKSPFCYVQGFTVKSSFEGIIRTYSAYISEDGVPSITLLSEEETTEHNGVEIILPVKPQDFYEFKTKAQAVYEFFPKDSYKFSDSNLRARTETYCMSGSTWKLRKNSSISGPRAIMGTVAYPISQDGSFSSEHSLIQGLPIDITFNIGDLEVAASREHLSYNKATLTNIKARYNQILDEVIDSFHAELDKCTTLWDARIKYVTFHNSELASVLKAKGKDLLTGRKYKHFTLDDIETKIKTKDFPLLQFNRRTMTGASKKVQMLVPLNKKDQDTTINVEMGEHVMILQNDRGCYAGMLTKQWMPKQDQIRTLYVISKKEKATTQADFQKQVDELSEKLGGAPIKTVTSLGEEVPRAPKGPRAKVSYRGVYVFDEDNKWANSWEKFEDEHNEGTLLYIPLEFLQPQDQLGMYEPSHLTNILKAGTKLGILPADVNVIGVSKAAIPAAQKLGAKPFSEFVLKQIEKHWNAPAAQKVQSAKIDFGFGYNGLYSLLLENHHMRKNMEGICPDSPILKYIKESQEVQRLRADGVVSNWEIMLSYAQANKVKLSQSVVNGVSKEKETQKALQRYPLLRLMNINRYTNATDMNLVFEYIASIDNA